MGTRKSKKLALMKETLRQLDPAELQAVNGGGGEKKGPTLGCSDDDALAVRTRRCAC